MRKMFSENQVKELVQKAINNGEIQINKYYCHYVEFQGHSNLNVYFFSKIKEAFTFDTLKTALLNGWAYPMSGDDNADLVGSAFYNITEDGGLVIYIRNDDGSDTRETFTDQDGFKDNVYPF